MCAGAKYCVRRYSYAVWASYIFAMGTQKYARSWVSKCGEIEGVKVVKKIRSG